MFQNIQFDYHDMFEIILYDLFSHRKIMILFPEEQKDYVLQELANVNADIMGQCMMLIKEDKATFLMAHRKNKKMSDDEAHETLCEMTSK